MKKVRQILLIFAALLLALSCLTACNADGAQKESTTDNADGSSLKIVTTIFPIYDWVKNITGSDTVVYLDENGIDLHSFEPTAQDILSLADADVFIYIGGESDKWVENAVKTANNPSLTTVALLDSAVTLEEETVEGMEAHKEDEDEAVADEHIWLSLKQAQRCVTAIADTLMQKDPANASLYEANAAAYNEKLASLDSRYAEAVLNAKRQTLLFADRFPFRYLTEDYSLTYYAAFPGCSAESEASFETLAFLIDKTKELSLPYILVLEGSDGKIAKTIAADSGSGILTLNSCQSVTADDVKKGTTYLSVMESNLQLLTEALN